MNIDTEQLPHAKPFFVPENGPRKPAPKPTWADIEILLRFASHYLDHAKKRLIDRYQLASVAGGTDYWPESLEEDVDVVINDIEEIMADWATYDVEEA